MRLRPAVALLVATLLASAVATARGFSNARPGGSPPAFRAGCTWAGTSRPGLRGLPSGGARPVAVRQPRTRRQASDEGTAEDGEEEPIPSESEGESSDKEYDFSPAKDFVARRRRELEENSREHKKVLQRHLQFYRAINSRDVQDMQNVWHRGTEVQCLRPLFVPDGEHQPVSGYDDILDVWSEMFKRDPNDPPDTSPATVSPWNEHVVVQGTTALVTCLEEIRAPKSPSDLFPPAIWKGTATALYRKVYSGGTGRSKWRLVFHHSSLCQPPEKETASKKRLLNGGTTVVQTGSGANAQQIVIGVEDENEAEGEEEKQGVVDESDERLSSLVQLRDQLRDLVKRQSVNAGLETLQIEEGEDEDEEDQDDEAVLLVEDLPLGDEQELTIVVANDEAGEQRFVVQHDDEEDEDNEEESASTELDAFEAAQRRILAASTAGTADAEEKITSSSPLPSYRDEPPPLPRETAAEANESNSGARKTERAWAQMNTLQRTLAFVRKLGTDGRITTQQKTTLISDVISQTHKSETPSLIEATYELILDGEMDVECLLQPEEFLELDPESAAELELRLEDFAEQCCFYADTVLPPEPYAERRVGGDGDGSNERGS